MCIYLFLIISDNGPLGGHGPFYSTFGSTISYCGSRLSWHVTAHQILPPAQSSSHDLSP